MTPAGPGGADTAVPVGDEVPDAFAKGWAVHDGEREVSLFVLSRESLGIAPADSPHRPRWVDLAEVRGMDAIGDPRDGVLEVEVVLDSGELLSMGWPDHFTEPVVAALRRVAGQDEPTAPSAVVAPAPAPGAPFGAHPAPAPAAPAPAAPEAAATAPVAPAPPAWAAPAAAPAEPSPFAPGPFTPAPEPEPDPGVPVPAPLAVPQAAPDPSGPPSAGAATGDPAEASAVAPPEGSVLVLEDVAYLGGHPAEPRKRRKCVATLSRDGLELTGPSGLAISLPWPSVRSVEAQNADEARFRMNTKIHRDATALVLECEGDVTVVLEARDCPTVPLRAAIASLVVGLRVVVV